MDKKPPIDDSEEMDYQEGDEPEEGHLIEEQHDSGSGRRRKRVKIRKRVRIKRKSSPKKKVKKAMSTIAWILILASFIFTIVYLILQLDLNSKHRNKRSVELQKPVPAVFYAENHSIA
jgi:hypothetical protein